MKPTTLSLAVLMATSALIAPWAAIAQEAPPADVQPEVTDTAAEEPITEVTVKGKFVPNSMRRTAEVVSIMTSEDLKRTGDDSAATALTRVTGLSLVEGRFVYVRGLGERYSSALLNGSPLPSPEPLQRVVPLDLFPSSILSRLSVQKTHSADYWGEFGGGVVDLKTVTTPASPFLSLSVSTGGNTETTGQHAFTHYGSDSDWFGFDDGTRKLPLRLRQAIATGKQVTQGNFTDTELQKIGQDFVNAPLNLIQETDSLPANLSFNVVGGRSFDVAAGELGVIGLVDFSNSWKVRNGIQQTAVNDLDKLAVYDDYDYSTSENNVSLNGLFGLGFRQAKHSVQWTNLFIRNTTKRTQVREGYDGANGEVRRREQSGWYERQLFSTQLNGNSDLTDKLTLNWRASYAQTERDVPYEKSITYGVGLEGRWYHDASRVRNRTDFSELNDKVKSAGASLDYDFSLGEGRDGTLTGGFDILENKRDAWNRQFSYLTPNNTLPTPVQYTRVDFLLSDFNISPDRLVLTEVTGGDGAAAYEGGLFVNAAFAKVDVEVIPLVRVAAGLRFESAKQRITTVNLFTSGTTPTPITPLKEEYLLPSATVTWNFADDMQLRGGISKTIGRPQFRELAPQVYLDPEQDRLFVGNPFLKDTEITNFDARYEWYYDAGQYITAGLFYKDIEKPVEATILDTGSGEGQQSYINAPKATLIGMEFDYKGEFDSPVEGAWFASKKWLVAANYTWTDSEVTAKSGDVVYTAANQGMPTPATNYILDGSRLQGQSEHVANVQFGWNDLEAKSQATLLLTYVSERVSARGKPGYPDYIQEPGAMLDFTYRKGFDAFGQELNFGLEVRNLLGTEYEEYQERNGRVNINNYDIGQSVSVSLSTQF
ncbi:MULTISPECIES: TonB-dependent receptor domain-containing protein [Asticcacaulis]|jgi:outer membrane receptor protein involved in Fe transport|uniref:TonB-dependent receptor n=1 Tax=Asticcacaulis endophyticus TaxID=1395890 RepID=A0A918Q016_9CAUL|nr:MULTISPECIES: TonB-dependent receptor [Asticcacaulis]WKL55772.1 TonB-dependent receptor [Asticcacaulis sp. ZE23SCel15]GGZ28993.1 TonB-dependent receptor [Asticcacaulis endophyticus]